MNIEHGDAAILNERIAEAFARFGCVGYVVLMVVEKGEDEHELKLLSSLDELDRVVKVLRGALAIIEGRAPDTNERVEVGHG